MACTKKGYNLLSLLFRRPLPFNDRQKRMRWVCCQITKTSAYYNKAGSHFCVIKKRNKGWNIFISAQPHQDFHVRINEFPNFDIFLGVLCFKSPGECCLLLRRIVTSLVKRSSAVRRRYRRIIPSDYCRFVNKHKSLAFSTSSVDLRGIRYVPPPPLASNLERRRGDNLVIERHLALCKFRS